MKKRVVIVSALILMAIVLIAATRVVHRYNFVLYDPDKETVHASLAAYDTSSVVFGTTSDEWYMKIYDNVGVTSWNIGVDGTHYSTDLPEIGTDPDVADVGYIGRDSDDHSLRGYDGTNQFIYGQKTKPIKFVVENPDQLTTGTARATKSFSLSPNKSGFSFIITAIDAYSDSDDYAFNLFESYSETDISEANDTLIDLVTCSIDGTGTYYANETTITHAVIENGHHIIFEHSSGTTTRVTVIISGYYNGDVD